MAWEIGIQVPFPLFFFAWHSKADLNFVFHFSIFAPLWKTEASFVLISFFVFALLLFVIFPWLEKRITAPVQSFEVPGHPLEVDRGIHFLCKCKQVNFSLPGAKVSDELLPPPMIRLTYTVLPFLTLQWMTNDMMIAAKKHAACIPSMEKENDEYLKTLQLEVTKCEITKNYKWSFTVFSSFCRMTQSLQSVFLVVISRIQQITTSLHNWAT